MGKGTKHKADWKETKLQVILDIRAFYNHSLRIMANGKVFNPKNDFHNITLFKIAELLFDLYLNAWHANRLNVDKDPSLAVERLRLQQEAIIKAKLLLPVLELVKGQFHLDARKFWNWMNMLVEVGKKLSAWHKADTERYSPKESLSNQDGGRLDARDAVVALR